jgi:hypothetical protein
MWPAKRPDAERAATSCVSLALLLVCAGLGCRGGSDGPGAGVGGTGDASNWDAQSPAGPDGPSAPRPETRAGFVSGTACQADEQCVSGACTLGVCSDWGHALRITIDTTPSGADLKEAVVDFPLLVRLDDDDFPFDQAHPNGADLRFVDPSGSTLDYEIERWDPDKGVARVWVRVPRVEGNCRDNTLLLYFGNPSAVPQSSGPAVFASFDLVLHMTDVLDGAKNQLIDSTGHANTGLVQAAPEVQFSADGIAGDGIQLDGDGTYLATSLRLPGPQAFSTSLWFKTDTPLGGALIAFAANQGGNGGRFDRTVWMDPDGRLSFAVVHDNRLSTLRSLASYRDDAWHLLVARFSGSGQYLMVDGESVADDPTSTEGDSYSGYWRFGEVPLQLFSSSSDKTGVQSNFIAGDIDEARVSSRAESDAWIKLSFATQRPDGHAVTYQMVP